MESQLDLIGMAMAWGAANPLLLGLVIAGVPLLVFVAGQLIGRMLGVPALDTPGEAEATVSSAQPAPIAEQAVEAVAPDPSVEVGPEPEPAIQEAPAPERVLEPAAEPRPSEQAPAPAVASEPVAPPAPPSVGLRDRLRRTSETLVGRLGSLVSGRSVDDDLLEELEMLLFSADLGVKTAEVLLDEVRKKASGKDGEAVRVVLRDAIAERLRRVEIDAPLALTGSPHVIVVLGVNGAGKTTTIGKLGARYAAAGHKVVFGAGDTFRAAAIEQLQAWGERVGCEVIAGKAGGDPTAVAFDTVKAAVARGADVAIIDTAGRLQTRRPLMEELGKLVRVVGRELEGAPHETLLVLDANTGQNAISQAKLFTEVAGVTGLVLTKLDGSAKGGVIVGLADEFGIPVKFVGVGEAIEDLRDFSADEFVAAVFEE
jgi:fused signal recognition particle receptor